jgi:hypothetical protein
LKTALHSFGNSGAVKKFRDGVVAGNERNHNRCHDEQDFSPPDHATPTAGGVFFELGGGFVVLGTAFSSAALSTV